MNATTFEALVQTVDCPRCLAPIGAACMIEGKRDPMYACIDRVNLLLPSSLRNLAEAACVKGKHAPFPKGGPLDPGSACCQEGGAK